MSNITSIINSFSKEFSKSYNSRKIILSFEEFLGLVQQNPRQYIRCSSSYLTDTFESFSQKTSVSEYQLGMKSRYSMFDLVTARAGKIYGGETVQNHLYDIIEKLKMRGVVDKLICLHGPNGSAKTSTVDKIALAMEKYSTTNEGASYRFSWVFPSDEDLNHKQSQKNYGIGFAQQTLSSNTSSYVYSNKIAAKIGSEFKENPLFLLPVKYREKMLRQWIAALENCTEDDVDLPSHILGSGLSKKNQEILEKLVGVYRGDLSKVFRHIQVERLFFSKQYRVGISTVDPCMSIDAVEKQVTLDRNYSFLPTALQDINFHEQMGELVDANRGILEFSDFLKRPLESFKYLLSLLDNGHIKFSSGSAVVDMVYIATTNDKHLDAFKGSPDFNSFKGRIEFITVPYLLNPSLEKKIYENDIALIEKNVKIAPHVIELLSLWATLTRVKKPNTALYPEEFHSVIEKLDPLSKIKLYENKSLKPKFSSKEEVLLKKIRHLILQENQGTIVYEGRFGVSPRDIRTLLNKCVRSLTDKEFTPLRLFEELRLFIKDQSLHEFLQYKPQGEYHNTEKFIKIIEEEFLIKVRDEIIDSMDFADAKEYSSFLKRYVEHVVAYVKKEKVWDPNTSSYQSPSIDLMKNVEKILKVSEDSENYRMALLSKIAAFKLENPSIEIKVEEVFSGILEKIRTHFFQEKKKSIENNYLIMIDSYHKNYKHYSQEELEEANKVFDTLEKRYGHSRKSAYQALKFMLRHDVKSEQV